MLHAPKPTKVNATAMKTRGQEAGSDVKLLVRAVRMQRKWNQVRVEKRTRFPAVPPALKTVAFLEAVCSPLGSHALPVGGRSAEGPASRRPRPVGVAGTPPSL